MTREERLERALSIAMEALHTYGKHPVISTQAELALKYDDKVSQIKSPIFNDDKCIAYNISTKSLFKDQVKTINTALSLPSMVDETQKLCNSIRDLQMQRDTALIFSADLKLKKDCDAAIKIEHGDLDVTKGEGILRFDLNIYKSQIETLVNEALDHYSSQIDEAIERLDAMLKSIGSLTK